LDLSRKRLDWRGLAADGERVDEGACPPDRDGLAHLVRELEREHGGPVFGGDGLRAAPPALLLVEAFLGGSGVFRSVSCFVWGWGRCRAHIL
jgi:hypothetical protein